MVAKVHCSSPQPNEWLKGNLIGSGSFGNVHMATDSTTGALFVMKSAISKFGITSLKNEAKILKHLDSPYIIKCIGEDLSTAKNPGAEQSLFFEYMAGGSLLNVMHNFGGTLDEKLIRLYTSRILPGLEYLHENGIVHCDVKCENVLVDASGAVKLADFGCAKRLRNRKSSTLKKSMSCNDIGGTPLWMAPEVLRNEGLDFAADIWSLGCTIIEMATGRSPWGGEQANPMAAMLRIANGDDIPEFPRHLSSDGLDFLSKCLQRDPRRRWTARELLRHPFVVGKTTTLYVAASSPTSVLCAVYDSDDDDEDYKEFLSSVGRGEGCLSDKNIVANNALENDSDSFEGWITVRSSNAQN